jgi:putative transposase
MVLEINSRKVVGHEVNVTESAELASLMMRKASLAERLAGARFNDVGTLEKVGIMPCLAGPV